MFKNMVSDALGISDIGKIIRPNDFGIAETDDYIFHEDNEKIYFLIKSKSDEYCFTNLAFIHLDGESATSNKKTLKRYSYSKHLIDHVLIETAGRIDLDAELKFTIGETRISIDIDKKELDGVKDIYKALTSISEQQRKRHHSLENIEYITKITSSMFNIRDANNIENFEQIYEKTFYKALEIYEKNLQKHYSFDCSHIFEHYINQ